MRVGTVQMLYIGSLLTSITTSVLGNTIYLTIIFPPNLEEDIAPRAWKADAGACLIVLYDPNTRKCTTLSFTTIAVYTHFLFFTSLQSFTGSMAAWRKGTQGWHLSFGDDEMDRGRLDDVTDKSIVRRNELLDGHSGSECGQRVGSLWPA